MLLTYIVKSGKSLVGDRGKKKIGGSVLLTFLVFCVVLGTAYLREHLVSSPVCWWVVLLTFLVFCVVLGTAYLPEHLCSSKTKKVSNTDTPTNRR
jgi:protein-S-isoprenylcysteine O-methyltransferase Ste14